MAILTAGSQGLLAAETGLTAGRIDAPLNPTTLVNGTASPGSPYRD
jgi:hypothetical protein